jgi:hypothetical protein
VSPRCSQPGATTTDIVELGPHQRHPQLVPAESQPGHCREVRVVRGAGDDHVRRSHRITDSMPTWPARHSPRAAPLVAHGKRRSVCSRSPSPLAGRTP